MLTNNLNKFSPNESPNLISQISSNNNTQQCAWEMELSTSNELRFTECFFSNNCSLLEKRSGGWGTVLSKQVDNRMMQILRKSRNSESNYY